jgi:uncharacterized membrane-anchored protein
MAATRPRSSAPSPAGDQPLPPPRQIAAPDQRKPMRTVSGPLKKGRRTKLLVKHLRRGDVALIDHQDLDRVSAEELIAAGVGAVLNCDS